MLCHSLTVWRSPGDVGYGIVHGMEIWNGTMDGMVLYIHTYLAEQTKRKDEHIAWLQVTIDDFVHVQEGKSTRNL